MLSATLKITGTAPLLMHSDRYANPRDPMTKRHKELTSKGKKTDEDHTDIARSEWQGSLYMDGDAGPCLPTVNIKSCLVEGARLNKLGKHLERGMVLMAEKVKLEYPGPRAPDAMWDSGNFVDARSVVVLRARLIRYRPRFDVWSISVEMVYDPTVVELDHIRQAADNAGRLIGLGDYRPNKGGPFGRFDAEVIA